MTTGFVISPETCGRALHTLRMAAEERGKLAIKAIERGSISDAYFYAQWSVQAAVAYVEIDTAPQGEAFAEAVQS